ncbi:MAG: PAS domain S-box protein [Pseudomonadota bacterium]
MAGGTKSELVSGIRDAYKTMEVLFEITDAVTSTLNLDELYRVIHSSLGKILNVDNFYIAIHNPEKDSIVFPYWVDEKDAPLAEIFNFSKTASLTGNVISAKKPLIFYEKDILELAKLKNQKAIGTPAKVWLGAPLTIRNRVTGALAIQSYRSKSMYRESDLDILKLVAQHIAIAIERKHSDQELQEQREILEKILETSPVGISLVENRVFKWVNSEMVRLFGYHGKEDFKDKSVKMIYASEADYQVAGEKIYSRLSTDSRVEFDLTLVRRDNTTFPAQIKLNSADPSSPMAWTIATIADISERLTAEEEINKREKLQGVLEMAGAVCHELNQPLQAILGYSELILMDQYKDTPLYNDLDAIRTQISRIGTITRRLSGITKYKTVDYPGNKKIVDIWGSSKDYE